MKTALKNQIRSPKKSTETASVRVFLLGVVSFFLGVAVTAIWLHRPETGASGNPLAQTPASPDGGPAAPPTQAAPPIASPLPSDPAVVEQVKQAVPNYASLSLEDGENILRTAALKEFAEAEKEMDDQLAAAQQKLAGPSDDEQPTVLKNLQETQAASAARLKEIASRLQAQMAALKSLKSQP